MQTQTLKDLQNALPIGVVRDGNLIKDFTLRPWRIREERQIGRIRERARGFTMGQFVSKVLSIMVEGIAGEPFERKSEGERRLFLNRMFMSDVLYIYIFLRYQALGNILKMKVTCPVCRNPFDFSADLETLDVRTHERAEDIEGEVELIQGLNIKGEMRKKLKIRPTLWAMLEGLPGPLARNEGELKIRAFRDSIIGVEGIESPGLTLTDDVLDEMVKRDIELLTREIDRFNAGADLTISDACPFCRCQFYQVIDWGYDYFFGISSL